eukprot:CAMPEP_0176029114 /NCGR_PEP_ID=MMETSP0120_2-20121206/14301_1 /TAXON_ID=160619 /ORGANISM="Kryptoperidinium foliaceum, Strain CCMP 1326" /LENGTH=354 /DNA_ID=CAMNT_0017362335 /DNA_START=1 /DNA_END=1065 /DNA_ORIENTATION=-
MIVHSILLLALLSLIERSAAFSSSSFSTARTTRLFATGGDDNDNSSSKATLTTPPRRISTNNDPAFLSQDSGGYTVKQRLREEVESPFRKVRLLFFGGSAGSALTALYFSMLNTIKAYAGGFSDAPPLDEALTSDAINIGAAIVCGFLAFREYQAGQSNLERIAQGGRLASLPLELANGQGRRTVKEYRRFSRVVLAAGGPDYISRLCRSLTADQLSDENILPQKLLDTDIVVVPILLSNTGSSFSVGDTKAAWNAVEAQEGDRNMDTQRANDVVAFPISPAAWETYLKSELDTAVGQGFDVLDKGITIIVKKNGRILRRATGLPPWGDMIATMEVADGSKFGMPGDSERYGGR